MINSTPACTEKCINPRLIEGQLYIRDLARLNIYFIHIHLTDCKSMNDIVGCETQMKRFADFSLNDIWTPTTVFCHLGVDKGCARPREKRHTNRPQNCCHYQQA